MTEAQIFSAVREIVADKLGIPEEEIQLDSEEFSIRVPDEAFESLRTVGQAVTFIHARVQEP